MARTLRWLDGDSAVPTGAILLNVEATSLPAIVHILLDQLIYEGQMKPQDRDDVMRTLLLRHRYNQGRRSRGGPRVWDPPQHVQLEPGSEGESSAPQPPLGVPAHPRGWSCLGGNWWHWGV